MTDPPSSTPTAASSLSAIDDVGSKEKTNDVSAAESAIDVTDTVINFKEGLAGAPSSSSPPPSSSSDEKSGNTSATSNTSSSSSSLSSPPPSSTTSSAKKQSFSSPPPQAFQSLPLASGTIHPPSFTTPMKPERQFDSTRKQEKEGGENTKTDDLVADKDDDIVKKEAVQGHRTTSSPISTATTNATITTTTAAVKGIDEYLPKTNQVVVDRESNPVPKSKITKEDEVVVVDRKNTSGTLANEEKEDTSSAKIHDSQQSVLETTPRSGNTTLQDDNINQGDKTVIDTTTATTDDNTNNKTNQLMRRNSEVTLQVTNESNTLLEPTINTTTTTMDLSQDNDSITSSIGNSNTRSLLPRSLDLSTSADESNGFRPNTLRGRGFVNIGPGASGATASVLSSQMSSSKESRERMIQNDLGRMRHLGMLLDRHHHQINSRRRNNIASEPWWQNEEDDSSIEKNSTGRSAAESSGSNLGPISMNSRETSGVFPSKSVLAPLGYTKQESVVEASSTVGDAPAVNNDLAAQKRLGRLNSIASGDSIQDLKSGRKNNDSLFENFDKTWQSFHEAVVPNDYEGDIEKRNNFTSLDTPIVREQICFASMVLVLLQQIPKKNADAETYWTKSVPMEIVKLFWEEVILKVPADKSSDEVSITLPQHCDMKSTTEQIADALLNKLRYVSIDTTTTTPEASNANTSSNSNKAIDDQIKSIKLSHDVYADYSKHILKKHNLLPENCVNQWNAKFVLCLRNKLDSHFKATTEASTAVPTSNQVLTYAASYIPKLILLSTHPEVSDINNIGLGLDANKLLHYQKDRMNFLIELMTDSTFLSQRMKILGGRLQEKRQDGNNDQVKRRFQSESYIDKIALDVLKATKVHIEDIESVNIVLSMMSKEFFVGEEGVVLDSTDTMLSLYKAWKDLCLKLLDQERLTDEESFPKVDPIVADDVVANFDRSRGTSGPAIQASEQTQRSLPKCCRLHTGEYELSISGSTASIIKNEATDRSQKENTRRSRHQESKEKSSAKMRLSHVLQIDPVHLYHYLSIGKSIHLLGKSIFEATFYTLENCLAPHGFRTLLGSMPNTTSINFIASSIDVYKRLTHLMSFVLSSDIGDVDEDDLMDMGYRYDKETGNVDPSLRMRKLLQDRTEARTIFEKLCILCGESWLDLGTYLLLGIAEGHGDALETAGLHLINHLEQNDVKDVDPSFSKEETKVQSTQAVIDKNDQRKHPLQSKPLLCFQMALGVLLHNPSCTKEQNVSFKTELTSVVVYARNLRASIIHAIGVHHYEQSFDYERAKIFLDSSLKSRRLLLRLLQREDADDTESLSGSSMNGGYKRRYQGHSRRAATRQRRKPKSQESHIVKKSRIDVILSFEMNRKKQTAMIEKGLSTTLEFSALASHCLFDYDASLSSFQEALILRASHSGKESLEVATLQYNMGVVHDDLAQHEASLGRYGESLRVRYTFLDRLREKIVFEPPFNASVLEFLDLEASVILTLRCMGNVYRALKDATNAIGCLMKAIELLKDKLQRGTTKTNSGLYQSADGDLGFGKGMMNRLPMPKIILNELKGGDEKISNIHVKHGETLAKRDNSNSDDEGMRREISAMYKTIITLLQERAVQRSAVRVGVISGYTSSASSYTTGSFSKTTRPTKNGFHSSSDNDSIHLDSAFNLGLLSLHFNDQKNALNYFEDALRTLWTTFSSESSGESSDSDYSKSSASRSSMTKTKRQKKIYFKGQVEEGALYHALAIVHASFSDHERAVRCYVTALRYYRRRFGLECTIVAGALYDCAFSYWKLGDNERAEDFWADCLKILLCGGDKAENKVSGIHDLHVARTLYNLAAAKICKGEFNDLYVSTCLSDAKSIFKRLSSEESQNFNVEIGHCSYYSAFLNYKKVVDDIDGKSSDRNEKSRRKEELLRNALSFADQSLHSYLSENRNLDVGLEQVQVGQKLQHPMQAHIAHLSAWIHDELGLITQAQWNYKTAIRLLNKVYTPDNLYSASAMHSLANLYMMGGNSTEALHNYKEALMRRSQLLGSDHPAVADTLFKMAGIIGTSQHYSKAASMYTHCLRIRMLSEGNEGDNVAETLLNLALLHDKNGQCRKAQECLEGALRVRKSRLQSIIHSCIAKVEKCVDGDSNDNVDCAQRKTRIEQLNLAYIMHNLGNILLKLGDTNEAMAFFNEALEIRRKSIGIDDGGFAMFVTRDDFESALELNRDILRDMADTLHNLGGVYEIKSMQQKALSCYNQALIIKRSTSKEKQVAFSLDDQIKSCNSLSSAFTLLRIGAIHNELYDHDVSLSYYKSAVNIQKQHLGHDHISVAQTLVDMGLILRRKMETDPLNLVSERRTPLERTANKYFNEALRISRLCHGPDHVSVAGIMYHIGSMYDQGGNYIEAMNHYQHSAKVFGREYARTLCKSLFQMTSVQRNQYDYVVDCDHGLFHPTSFRTNFSPIESNRSMVLSRGVVQHSTKVADIDRDAYLRASFALAQVATKSGFVWMHSSTFQNFLLRILHFIATNGIDPIRDTLHDKISYLMNNFAKASNHAIVTMKDTPQNNFLYLIND